MNNSFLVCVRCMTFNHAPYIEDAMNGFTMQQTTFPFVCVIMDDASTDGEQEVIKKYLHEHFNLDDKSVVRNEETDDYTMTFAQHKDNKNCFFAVYFLKYNHYSIKKPKIPYLANFYEHSKYQALCEGDDYWIAPKKIQKQAGIMENDDEVGLVYTAYRLKNEITGKIKDIYTSPDIKHDKRFQWQIIAQKVMVGTNTAMLRTSLHKQIREFKEDFSGFLMGDTQTWFHSARLSKVEYIREVMGVYRKQPTGATATFDAERRLRFLKNCLDLHLHLAYKYGAPKETVKRIKEVFYTQILSLYLQQKDYSRAETFSREMITNHWVPYVCAGVTKCFGAFPNRVFGKLFHYANILGCIKFCE